VISEACEGSFACSTCHVIIMVHAWNLCRLDLTYYMKCMI